MLKILSFLLNYYEITAINPIGKSRNMELLKLKLYWHNIVLFWLKNMQQLPLKT